MSRYWRFYQSLRWSIWRCLNKIHGKWESRLIGNHYFIVSYFVEVNRHWTGRIGLDYHLVCPTLYIYQTDIESSQSTWAKTDNLEKFNLIINCTSLGFDVNDKKMPLSTKQFENLKKNAIFFDIIYNPKQTLLLEYASKLGHRTFNGLNMNLEQAVLAYAKVNSIQGNLEEIRNNMLSVIT